MSTTVRYTVPGISCQHCVNAITSSVGAVPGVSGIDISIDDKTVTVSGEAVPGDVVAAIEEAGYEIDPAAADGR